MQTEMYAINLDDYKRIIGIRPFVALPKEEIDRLYASIEIHTLDQEQADADVYKLQLSVFTVIHFNYSWFTFRSIGDAHGRFRSLGFTDLVRPGNFNGLFLDETLSYEAERILQKNISIKAGYTLRLAGLLYGESGVGERPHLSVLYVARLHQADSIAAGDGVHDILYYNNGELQLCRDLFNPWSRTIVDHLIAL